ncbi:porin family protein [Thiocapsa marina]|uniref:PEP-CTERM system associated protein n=1 Tax=Thiocapsa marina 5811 TaxID=768671 RepID=F9UAQ8_9GAMM|nr:hypothetical protein [Thiocapsa marina]EGV18526.1 hypothetical protein ThimaDRAFT_1944 [Thiocapsa marina 5811]
MFSISRHRRESRLSIPGAVLIALFSPPVSAELAIPAWDFEPGLSLRLFYDDNVRLSSENPQGSFGGIAEAYGLLSHTSEISEISIRAAVDSSYYADVTELDSTDGALDIIYAYRMDRVELGLEAGFVYDSTLTSEEETTGLVQLNKRRSLFEIRPSMEYEVSERARVGAEVLLQDVSYEDVQDIVLSNYQFLRFGLNGHYDLSERTALIGRAIYDRYDAEQNADQSETYGAEVGFRYRVSERMVISGLAGGRSASATSDSPTQAGSGRSTGPIFEFGLERDYEIGSISLGLQRSLLPSGRGTLLDTTRANLVIARPITERATARLRASVFRNRNPGGEVSLNDRDFFLISPGVRWRLAESTWVDLSYRFRMQSREVLDTDAESNAVFLGLSHDWAAR